MMNNSQCQTIKFIAEQVAKVVPGFCGVTLGGSRSHDLEDSISDAEMYFYSNTGIPTLEVLDKCLNGLGATLKRSKEFLWNEEPWGPHSFFEYNGVYFEIGYRIVDEVKEKIKQYHEGQVKPRPDCNDLGLGYMLSAFSASVVAEKEIYLCGSEIKEIKQMASMFPDTLFFCVKKEYLDVAHSFLDGKLLSAAKRADYLFYDVIASRIVRSMFVMAFALTKTHFPGDKWNESLLLQTSWEDKERFINLIRKHYFFEDYNKDEFLNKREILVEAISLIDKKVSELYGESI